ncbi:MAG: alpha-amylase family protein [Verrucomicrobiota bacterium]|jgi:hypothetical protein
MPKVPNPDDRDPFPPPPMNRRHFLRCSAVFGGGVMLSPLLLHASDAPAAAPAASLPWYRQPLCILQTVLRETDARNYDVAAVVGYIKKTGYNTLIVNAGGIVDFFQNPLPAANLNPFMGDRDILHEITTACRAAGLRVVARVDFRGVEEQVFRQHPDWFSLDAAGDPLQLDYTRPRLYASCYTGYYRNEHAQEFIRYLFTHYPLDGIWHNSVGVDSICYCARCRESYQQAAGAPVPDPASASPAALDRYMVWKASTADQYMARMQAAVKAFSDDKAYAAEVFSMFNPGGRINSGIDLYNARDHFDFMVGVAFPIESTEPTRFAELNYAGTVARFMKSMAPEKEAVVLYGENGTLHRYIMDPPVDLRIYLWEALAAGGRFWNTNFTGSYPDATSDRRNAFNDVEACQFVRRHQKLLAQHVPVAAAGVYYSRPTRLFYRRPSAEGDRFDAGIKGVERVLVEGHIPYDFIPDDQLSPQRLRRYRVVILPNVRCLTRAETDQLRGFVRDGGNLLATFATSLNDVDGATRADFGLADVFGCSFTDKIADTRQDCYQYILQPKHPLVAPDSGATELLFNAGHTLLCRPVPDAEVICTHVPEGHNQPPEKAWVEAWSREFPTVVGHRYGKGNVLYFANQPDQISYDVGHPDARNLLLRGVRLLAGSPLPVESTAPESVHVGLTQSLSSPGQYIMSLVNTTAEPVRPVRRLLPVFDLEVKLHLAGRELAAHQVLRAQGKCRVEARGPDVRVRVARLDDFFAIHLQMRG